MMIRDTSARVCVIGAGPSGITAGKNLLQAGVRNIVIYEKGDQVGGNWIYSPRLSHSSVFDTTHIISSKTLSQYEDYPMPVEYPDYPSHKQLLAYFQGYAAHFGVTDLIRFNTEVKKAEKQADETWKITLGDDSVEIFDYLLVANGHHWNPRLPNYPGEFTGTFLHSHDFKNAESFKDQRVLVIGGGNSACDIAVETSRVSAFTAISMRRGYYIAPKFMMGKPIDVLNARFVHLPDFIRIPLLRFSLWLNLGDYADYGLERPTHGPLQQHPTTNSELLYFIRHGKVHPRRDIARFEGKTVHFVDGKAEDYDAIIAATGFIITFPFFDKSLIDYSEGDVPLYLRVFHPDHPSLFFIGLCQPLGCVWPLADMHAKLAANTIIDNYTPPSDMSEQIAAEVAGRKRQFIKAARHTIEVEYHKHLWALQREMPKNAPAWSKEQTTY
jgi:thioredoxin reductase